MSSTLLNADTGRPIGDSHPLPVRIVAGFEGSGVPITTTPTIPHATSTAILPSEPRRAYLMIRNDTGGPVMLSLSGDPLTGTVPSAANKGLVLPGGAVYESTSAFCPTGEITAYQASGTTTNALTVVQGLDDERREDGVPTTTTPTVASGASTTLLGSNAARRYLLIQNETAGTVMLSLSGAPLAGVAPTATNVGLALPPGEAYESSPGFVPTGPVTVYQTSGAATNAIVVVEG